MNANIDIQGTAEKFYAHSLYIRGYSPNTIKRYKTAINYYARQAGITYLHEATSNNARAFFYFGRTQRNWSANTFIVFRKSLFVFFRWCIENKYLILNPIDDIETPKVESRLPSHLTKQEAFRLLEVIYNYPFESEFVRCRNHAMFSVFIFAGLRRQEALNLKFMDVDLENLTLFVHRGKGGKDRVIPICHTLAVSLKRYCDIRKKSHKICPQFFASRMLDMGLTDNGLKHLVDMLNKKAKLKFTIHKLRHTFATLMIEGGCNIYSLSQMMGHADIRTTTVYLAASTVYLHEQIMKHPLNEF